MVTILDYNLPKAAAVSVEGEMCSCANFHFSRKGIQGSPGRGWSTLHRKARCLDVMSVQMEPMLRAIAVGVTLCDWNEQE